MILFQLFVGRPETYTFANLIDVANRIMTLLLIFAVGSAVIAFLWASYLYMSSFGSEERVKNAKNVWYWTLIGLAVMLLAKVIIATGVRVLEPGAQIRENIERIQKGETEIKLK